MSTLRDAHQTFAWIVIVANGVAGGWALLAERLPRARRRALWWFTAAAEATVLVQVVLGVALVSRMEAAAPRFHMFYGFVALIAVTILYGYRAQLRHRIYLLYGFGGLFVMGLAIRALLLRSG